VLSNIKVNTFSPINFLDDATDVFVCVFIASDRMGNLAIPKTLRKGESDLKDKPFSVSPNALKYRATKRIKEIAQPKERENDIHIRENPNEIPQKALTYKATPRIINLARPREH